MSDTAILEKENSIIENLNRDYLAEAKVLDMDKVKEKAELVFRSALQKTISTDRREACQELYDNCKKGSDLVDLTGVWTIVLPYNGFGLTCSGGILVVPAGSTQTSSGIDVTASFVSGGVPTGPQNPV